MNDTVGGVRLSFLYGSIPLLLGLSQILLSLQFEPGSTFVAIAAGGWLLVGIGGRVITRDVSIASPVDDRRLELLAIAGCLALSLWLVLAATSQVVG